MATAKGRETSAVVVRTRALRESDLVVVLVTPELGKVACIARGARKSRKRFAGGLPIGAIGEARIAPGRGSLEVLEAFVPQRDHSRLGRDLEVFAYVAYLCELADELSADSERDPALFAILVDAIEQCMVGGAQAAILRAFELRLLASLGLLPELETCAVCGDAVGGANHVPFDLQRGGALCLKHQGGARLESRALLELARTLLEDGGNCALEDRGLGPGIRRGLRDLCLALIRRQLRRPLRSVAFFAQLPKPGSASPDRALDALVGDAATDEEE